MMIGVGLRELLLAAGSCWPGVGGRKLELVGDAAACHKNSGINDGWSPVSTMARAAASHRFHDKGS